MEPKLTGQAPKFPSPACNFVLDVLAVVHAVATTRWFTARLLSALQCFECTLFEQCAQRSIPLAKLRVAPAIEVTPAINVGLFYSREVRERITVPEHKIGILADLDAPNGAIHLELDSRVDRAHLERVLRRMSPYLMLLAAS